MFHWSASCCAATPSRKDGQQSNRCPDDSGVNAELHERLDAGRTGDAQTYRHQPHEQEKDAAGDDEVDGRPVSAVGDGRRGACFVIAWRDRMQQVPDS
jgi:hypothetical protein